MYRSLPDLDTGDSTLPLFPADASLFPGSKVLIDAFDPNCYSGYALPAGAIAAGTQLINLVTGAAELAVDAAGLPALGTAGFVIDAANRRILLPASAKNTTVPSHFIYGFWIKPAAQVLAVDQIGVVASHITGSSDAGVDWMCSNSQANPTTYTFRSANSYNAITGVAQDVVAMLAQEVVVNSTAATIASYGYKDTILANTSAAKALPAGGFPIVGGNAYIGHQVFPGAGWWGQIGRFFFHDLSQPGAKTVAEFLAAEMAQGAGPRFA